MSDCLFIRHTGNFERQFAFGSYDAIAHNSGHGHTDCDAMLAQQLSATSHWEDDGGRYCDASSSSSPNLLPLNPRFYHCVIYRFEWLVAVVVARPFND